MMDLFRPVALLPLAAARVAGGGRLNSVTVANLRAEAGDVEDESRIYLCIVLMMVPEVTGRPLRSLRYRRRHHAQ